MTDECETFEQAEAHIKALKKDYHYCVRCVTCCATCKHASRDSIEDALKCAILAHEQWVINIVGQLPTPKGVGLSLKHLEEPDAPER